MKQQMVLDWKSIRNRVRESESALEASLHPDESALAGLFDQRAEALARRLTAGSSAGDRIALLIFRMDQTAYALELTSVAEVGRLSRCTPVPGASRELCGVFAHRGQVRSVVDMAVLLGCTSQRQAPGGFFIHLRQGRRHARLRVDELDQIVNAAAGDVLCDTNALAGPAAELVRGYTREGVAVLRSAALLDRIAGTSKSAAADAQAQPNSQQSSRTIQSEE